MSNVKQIIDVASEPVAKPEAAPASAGTTTQSVPLKIDATQMQQMLQSMMNKSAQGAPTAGANVETQVERINPAAYIKLISDEMERLYARFDKLKKLAVELHGKQLDAPIPDSVKIKNIVINFSLVKDGKEEDHEAEIRAISSVGDITGLMSTEFGVIILALTEQAKQLQDLAQKTGERCSSALKEWENNNKDKKIVRAGEEAVVSMEPAENATTDAPVTLEAS